jgi:hypothetical protein
MRPAERERNPSSSNSFRPLGHLLHSRGPLSNNNMFSFLSPSICLHSTYGIPSTGHETDNASHVVLLVLQIVCSAKHCHVFWKLLISITASTKSDFPVDVLVDGTIPRLGSSDHNRWIGY